MPSANFYALLSDLFLMHMIVEITKTGSERIDGHKTLEKLHPRENICWVFFFWFSVRVVFVVCGVFLFSS